MKYTNDIDFCSRPLIRIVAPSFFYLLRVSSFFFFNLNAPECALETSEFLSYRPFCSLFVSFGEPLWLKWNFHRRNIAGFSVWLVSNQKKTRLKAKRAICIQIIFNSIHQIRLPRCLRPIWSARNKFFYIIKKKKIRRATTIAHTPTPNEQEKTYNI